MYFAPIDVEGLIREDVPYFDLTSFVLGLDRQKAKISCFTRQECTVCATEEADAVFRHLGIQTIQMYPSGTVVPAGTSLITGVGEACKINTAWKVVQNLLDHTSGIATKTRRMVDAAHAVNPGVAILTTRKMFPGTKALAIKGIMAGGAFPHRLGLSETILVFAQHWGLMGGMEAFLERLPEIRRSCCEKKIVVETNNLDDALALCRAGVDGLQLEKLSPDDLSAICQVIFSQFPDTLLLAAGGINEKNVAEYAKTGVHGIVTTSLYTAQPVDIGVKITPVDEENGKEGV